MCTLVLCVHRSQWLNNFFNITFGFRWIYERKLFVWDRNNGTYTRGKIYINLYFKNQVYNICVWCLHMFIVCMCVVCACSCHDACVKASV